MQIKKFNLNDENSYQLKISYKQDARDKNFKVTLTPANSSRSAHELNELNIDLSIPFYLDLEMGRGHVGFVSSLLSSEYCA